MAEAAPIIQPIMASPPNPEMQAVERQLNHLTTQIMYASENGLFSQTGWHFKNRIDAAIEAAYLAVDGKKPREAAASTYEAKRHFDEAWNAAPKMWLAFNERGWMHHLFTFIGAGMAGMVLWAVWQDEFCHVHKCSALFGMLGAVVRCLYWTSFQANQRMLRRVWASQNCFGPLIGLILGCVADFLFRTSLVIVTQEKAEPNPYMSAVLVFYAGFNWEWILSLLGKVASQVKVKGNESKESSKPQR